MRVYEGFWDSLKVMMVVISVFEGYESYGVYEVCEGYECFWGLCEFMRLWGFLRVMMVLMIF